MCVCDCVCVWDLLKIAACFALAPSTIFHMLLPTWRWAAREKKWSFLFSRTNCCLSAVWGRLHPVCRLTDLASVLYSALCLLDFPTILLTVLLFCCPQNNFCCNLWCSHFEITHIYSFKHDSVTLRFLAVKIQTELKMFSREKITITKAQNELYRSRFKWVIYVSCNYRTEQRSHPH